MHLLLITVVSASAHTVVSKNEGSDGIAPVERGKRQKGRKKTRMIEYTILFCTVFASFLRNIKDLYIYTSLLIYFDAT